MKERFLLSAGIITDNDRVVLVQNRWSVGTFWMLPGGRLEPGESLAEAAVREVAEETGLAVEPEQLAFVLDYYNRALDSHFVWHVFACRTIGGRLATPAGDEFVVDARWIGVSELDRYITWPQYRDPLRDFLAGRHQPYYVDKDAGLK